MFLKHNTKKEKKETIYRTENTYTKRIKHFKYVFVTELAGDDTSFPKHFICVTREDFFRFSGLAYDYSSYRDEWLQEGIKRFNLLLSSYHSNREEVKISCGEDFWGELKSFEEEFLNYEKKIVELQANIYYLQDWNSRNAKSFSTPSSDEETTNAS